MIRRAKAPRATVAPRPAWRHAPLPPVHPDVLDPALGALVAIWIAVAGPWLRARALPASEPQQVAAVGLLATMGILALPRKSWILRLGVAALTAFVLLPYQGVIISAWLGAGLILAAWVVKKAPPLPFLPPPGVGAVAPVAVLCGVAAWQGAREGANWQPMIPLAIAYLIPILSRFGNGGFDRLAKRVGTFVADVVSPILFAFLSLFLVLLPWAVQRLLRVDPLHSPHGWGDRDRRPLQAAQPWALDPASTPAPWSQRLKYPLAFGATALLIVGIVFREDLPFQDGGTSSSSSALGVTSDSGSKATWYPEYKEDITWALQEKVALRPFEVYRLLDFETRYVNVHDNHRDSWQPPSCDCPELTVWMYGGGGAFGLEQRDDHTIASELARLAYADGIALDVQNRGIPGQLHWRSSLRFANDLTTNPKPDLVVFYDGAEEIESALALDAKGLGDVRAPYEPLIEDLWDEINERDDPIPPHPDTATFQGWPTVSKVPKGQVGLLASRRYARSLQLSSDTAAQAEIPIRYFWQPSAFTRPDIERKALADANVAREGKAFAEATDRLPDQVVDLSAVFEPVQQRLFADPVHHDERGALLVARAMYRELKPQIDRLADRPSEGS